MTKAIDLVRILYLEKYDNCRVYTVSSAGHTDDDKLHTKGNYSKRAITDELVMKYQNDILPFHTVNLDYFFNSGSYLKERCSVELFSHVFNDFAKTLLQIYGNYEDDIGVIWIPFLFYFLECVVLHDFTLCENFIISFITLPQKESVPLLKCTLLIDEIFMNETLGKRLNQEDTYCVVQKYTLTSQLNNSSVTHIHKSNENMGIIVDYLKNIEDDVMFIRLKAFHEKVSHRKRKNIFLSSRVSMHFSNQEGGIYLISEPKSKNSGLFRNTHSKPSAEDNDDEASSAGSTSGSDPVTKVSAELLLMNCHKVVNVSEERIKPWFGRWDLMK